MQSVCLEAVGEDVRALRIVSPAYAGRDGELTSVLQYVYQATLLGETNSGLAGVFSALAADELRHLQILGTLITRLGAPPVFTACPPYPVSYYSASCVNYVKRTEEILAADRAAERASIERYTRMLDELENPAVAEVIAQILSEEREHLNILNRLRA